MSNSVSTSVSFSESSLLLVALLPASLSIGALGALAFGLGSLLPSFLKPLLSLEPPLSLFYLWSHLGWTYWMLYALYVKL